MSNSIDSLESFGEVPFDQVFNDDIIDLVLVLQEDRKSDCFVPIIGGSDCSSDIPAVFEVLDSSVNCNEPVDSSDEYGRHYLLI